MNKYSLLFLLVAIPMGAQQTTGQLHITQGQPGVVNIQLSRGGEFPETFMTCYPDPANKSMLVSCDPKNAVTIAAKDSTVVKLSDEEYSHLQVLRQAVVDEEKRLAVKYGADVPPLCSSLFSAQAAHVCEMSPLGPHYEFHQQFLLIDRSK